MDGGPGSVEVLGDLGGGLVELDTGRAHVGAKPMKLPDPRPSSGTRTSPSPRLRVAGRRATWPARPEPTCSGRSASFAGPAPSPSRCAVTCRSSRRARQCSGRQSGIEDLRDRSPPDQRAGTACSSGSPSPPSSRHRLRTVKRRGSLAASPCARWAGHQCQSVRNGSSRAGCGVARRLAGC